MQLFHGNHHQHKTGSRKISDRLIIKIYQNSLIKYLNLKHVAYPNRSLPISCYTNQPNLLPSHVPTHLQMPVSTDDCFAHDQRQSCPGLHICKKWSRKIDFAVSFTLCGIKYSFCFLGLFCLLST